jgi:hypothetical protein
VDGDPPERRLRAVAPRRAEDRQREDLTDVFRMTWEHGVNGQAQVIKGMQQIIHAYTLLQDKEAMSEAVANVRWLIAAGIRDFRAMLDELGKLQTDLPRAAVASSQDRSHRPNPHALCTITGTAACGIKAHGLDALDQDWKKRASSRSAPAASPPSSPRVAAWAGPDPP